MIKCHVDTTGERFGSATTIAHLAQFSFNNQDSDHLNIYQAHQIITKDWGWEVEEVDMEYALAIKATFKDGSALSVSAWADCCRPGDHHYGNCHWCGGRYAND